METDLAITGKPAQLGRGIITEVAGKIIGQFADCLGQRLGAEADAERTRLDAEAQARWEAHRKQVIEAEQADQEAALTDGGAQSSYTSGPAEGSLASDEALQALRDKLTHN